MRAEVVRLHDPSSALYSGAAAAVDHVERLKAECGYVLRSVDWCLELCGVSLLDAFFDKLGGDLATVGAVAEEWRRAGLAARVLADNYRAMAAAVPQVWVGDAAQVVAARWEEFAANLDDTAECVEATHLAVEGMLAATVSALEVLALLLSLVDEVVVGFAGSAGKVLGELATGGRRVRRIIRLGREAFATLDALADLVPGLVRLGALTSATLTALDYSVLLLDAGVNAGAACDADDLTEHLPFRASRAAG